MKLKLFILFCLPIVMFGSCSEKEEGASIKGSIAFRSQLDHEYGEIYTVEQKSGKLRRVSSFEAKYPRESAMNSFDRDDKPILSPDGKKVAYISGVGDKLILANLSNEDRKDMGMVLEMAWSPDGSKLAYIPNNLSGQIHVCNADGSEERQLTFYNIFPIVNFRGVYWQKDGSLISSSTNGDGTSMILRINTQDGTIQDTLNKRVPFSYLNHFNYNENKLCWAGKDSVFVMDLKNTSLKGFKAPGALSASLSPDGRRIAYTYESAVSGKLVTNIATINATNGLDKFMVTEEADITLAVRIKMNFTPCWYNNKTLLLGAGDILLIKDEMKPKKEVFVLAAGAYGNMSYVP